MKAELSIDATNPAMPILSVRTEESDYGCPLHIGPLSLQTVQRLEELARHAREAYERR